MHNNEAKNPHQVVAVSTELQLYVPSTCKLAVNKLHQAADSWGNKTSKREQYRSILAGECGGAIQEMATLARAAANTGGGYWLLFGIHSLYNTIQPPTTEVKRIFTIQLVKRT